MLISFLLAAAAVLGESPISVTAIPTEPFVEVRAGGKHLNFDLILHNTGGEPLRLVAIREQVLDATGQLEQQREINANGTPSALSGLGDLVLAPGSYNDLFQPFQDFGDTPEDSRVRLILIFLHVDRPVPPVA